jgi:protoheme IX farnesyltransferase
MTRLSRLAALGAAATFLLIALGGLSRTQPGAGCPDWPLCQGGWLPPLDPAVLVDWFHRTVSASLGLLLFATAVVAGRTPAAAAGTRRAAWAAVGLILLQSGIGALTVGVSPAWASTLHLGLAMLLFAATLLTLLLAVLDRGAPAWLAGARDPVVRRAALVGSAAVLLLVLSGAAANASAVAVACNAWPFCPDGPALSAALVPAGPGYGAATLSAALVALVVLGLGWRRTGGAVRAAAAGAVGVVALQAIAGGATVAAGHPQWIGPVYLATLTLLLAALLAVAVLAGGVVPAAAGTGALALGAVPIGVGAGGGASLPSRTGSGGVPAAAALDRLRRTVGDYAALTKPGIMSLLLTTTLGAMLIAAAGLPPFWLTVATLLGGVLASGGANVLNCYIDRDIDAQMSRTRHRASAAGRVSPGATLAFGVGLTVLAVAELWLVVNPLAAALALAGNLFYVFVYTLWLKRRTPQNIVIGGAAGAVPPLVGWAAVTGDLSPLAWGLFAVIFLWTPPHFWSLALLKQGEYGRVGVPMLPNVAGEAETRKQIVVYTLLLALLCVALTPFGLGPLYLAATVAVNGVFLLYAVRLYRTPSKQTARGMFFYSLWYLALVFGAAVADRLLLG